MKPRTYVWLLVSIFVLLSPVLRAQDHFTREQKRQYREAEDLFAITDYLPALIIYQGLYDADPNFPEINQRIGTCLYFLRDDKKEAFTYLQKAGWGGYGESWYYLGRCHHQRAEIDSALKYYRKYGSIREEKDIPNAEVSRYVDQALFARTQLEKTHKTRVVNLGRSINSKYPDYAPLIPGDDSFLLFTSRREGSTGGEKDPYGRYFEDIYISRSAKRGWSEPQPLDSAVNTNLHDAGAALSADGQSLILFRTSKDLTTGSLYWSDRQGTSWTEPELLGPEINSKDYIETSASLEPEGNVLYFSSDRPGGYGGKDIYRVVRFGNGQWSQPSILGPTVNTPYDEDAPFIHPDRKTLYFSSNGHRTMGGYDIFRTRLDDNGLWTVPENLGAPINSVHQDIYFVLSSNGKTGYYSSDRDGGFGATDIYKVDLPANKVSLNIVKGVVRDGKTGDALIGTITVEHNDGENTLQGIYQANSNTGRFLMVLDPNVGYTAIVEAPGYEPLFVELFYPDKGFLEIARDFMLEPSQ